MDYLYDQLLSYSNNGYYPMHMPGHKRNTKMLNMVNPYSIDITEIDGFDDLHNSKGILSRAMDRAKRLYSSEETYFLINGSTVGILAGIVGSTKKGDKVLVARNCHKSVYNAILLNELKPIYIYPEIDKEYGISGGICPGEISRLLSCHKDIKLVVITSPTYEGVVSDIKSIADIVHGYKVPLIVDEAHGAHFGFHKELPSTSIGAQADIVIHSVHKTLPSFTQSAIMHINGNIVKKKEIHRYLSIFQSSSPSYILISGIDQCMRLLDSTDNFLFEDWIRRIEEFRTRLSVLKNIKMIDDTIVGNNSIYDYDISRLVISVKDSNITGLQLYTRLLQQYKIQMELVSKDYIIGITSICDTKEGFKRLSDALIEIDKDLVKETKYKTCNKEQIRKSNNELDIAIPIFEVYNKKSKKIKLLESEGSISYEYAYLYPPGIPLIVPGEIISSDIILILTTIMTSGLKVEGLEDEGMNFIRVVDSQ